MSRTQRLRRAVSLRVRMMLLLSSIIALVLFVLGVLVYTGLQRTMLALVDLSLERAVTQALTEDLEYGRGLPTFIDTEDEQQPVLHPFSALSSYQAGPAVRVLSADGSVSSGIGPYESLPVWLVSAGGFSTEGSGNKKWRVYSQPLAGRQASRTPGCNPCNPWIFSRRPSSECCAFFLLGFRFCW